VDRRATNAIRIGLAIIVSVIGVGCDHSNMTPTMPTPAATSLFTKYGGAPTIAKVVNDAVTGLLADPVEAPFFAALGQPGHDTPDRLKSCLRLQFTALFGGPATYPGVDDLGDQCRDMTAAHAAVGLTGPVFDRFISDLTGVLTADGVSQADIAAIAPTLTGLKSQIVTR
jgi:truncated hemoglobin YjbI